MQHPSKKLILVWWLRLIPMVGFGAAFSHFLSRWSNTLAVLLFTVLAGAAVLLAAYVPQYWRAFSYETAGDTVTVRSFVFLRRTVVLPQARLLFARTYQTPLYTLLRLHGVVLFGCGMRVVIPALEWEQARQLASLCKGESDG